MSCDAELTEWLQKGDPVIRLLTIRELLGEIPSPESLLTVIHHPQVRSLVNDILAPWPPLVSHKSAAHPLHKMVFLSEIGLSTEQLGVSGTIDRLMAERSEKGMFRVTTNVPMHFGGTGKAGLAWALCDSPSVAYAMARFGYVKEARTATAAMVSLCRDYGWPCTTSPELGGFRGPGRKDDPCPYANLMMLRLMSAFPDTAGSKEATTGIETALTLWEKSREKHPYQFYMGTDFRKLKLPFIWYDILHLAEILSRFPMVRKDERFLDILERIDERQGPQGRYVPGSVWTTWSGWDFCQKKEASRWITFAVLRIHQRVGI